MDCNATSPKKHIQKPRERGRKQERKKGRKGYQNPNKSKLKKIIHFINSHVLFLALVTSSVEGREKEHSHKTLQYIGIPELPQSQNPADF
jgi:hypothetical protein